MEIQVFQKNTLEKVGIWSGRYKTTKKGPTRGRAGEFHKKRIQTIFEIRLVFDGASL